MKSKILKNNTLKDEAISQFLSKYMLPAASHSQAVTLTLSLALSFALPLYAQAAEKSLYNPKPLPDDLVLPMPNGAEMVFRPVLVPGANFWGDNQRIVELGVDSNNLFSAKQKSLINGSFPSKDGNNWLIWIAKYELTQGQYAAVMGNAALEKNSGYQRQEKNASKKYSALKGRSLKSAKTKPLAWVTYAAVNEFIQTYNAWLFDVNHPERLKNLPKIDNVPGFIRLPTEEEWEFSARGGAKAVFDGKFVQEFPFPEQKLRRYAFVGEKKIKGIKNKKLANPLGIHGLYGNVQEMVAGIFRPEMTQGKPGGIIIRGGAYDANVVTANPALRREMDLYRWDSDKHIMLEASNYKVGARLAIGSNVIPHKNYGARLKKDLSAYLASVKQKTPVGQRNQNLAGQATAQLADIDEVLRQIVARHPDVAKYTNDIQQRINGATENLDQAQYKAARSLVQDATRNGVNLLELLKKRAQINKFIAISQEGLTAALRDEAESGLSPAESGSAKNRANIKAFNVNLAENKKATASQLRGYLEKISEVSKGYQSKYQNAAIVQMENKDLSVLESHALQLVKQHILYYNEKQKISKEACWGEFQQAYANYAQKHLRGEMQ